MPGISHPMLSAFAAEASSSQDGRVLGNLLTEKKFSLAATLHIDNSVTPIPSTNGDVYANSDRSPGCERCSR